jgi:hypothetical protein
MLSRIHLPKPFGSRLQKNRRHAASSPAEDEKVIIMGAVSCLSNTES